jgi:transglutaminase-like putative cysteine protease/predicted glutamine amidotransferase
MPNLLAMSFEGSLTPAFDLHCLDPDRVPPDGWGIACYPGGEPAALILKEAAPSQGSLRSALVSAWERLESSIFLVHVRTAIWGAITEANTQPFQRSWGRRDWLIAHSGSLERKLALTSQFEPVGSTDTEQILCDLLARIADCGFRSLAEVPPKVLLSWFHDLNRHGGLTTALSDGQDLAVYADRRGQGEAYVWEILPPHEQLAFGDRDVTIDLTRRGNRGRKGIVISSNPLEAVMGERTAFRRLLPGHLLIVRQGLVRAELGPEVLGARPTDTPAPPPHALFAQGTLLAQPTQPQIPSLSSQAAMAAAPPAPPGQMPLGMTPPPAAFEPRARPVHNTARAEVRRYEVLHRTIYRYQKSVERSSHVLRLFPVHDRLQTVHACSLQASVRGTHRDFEDVFGNRVRRLMLETPFTELAIEARSDVELLDVEPLDFRPARVRSTIPLVWMPWQRQILQPFLLPPELPESELAELTEYAMSFAQRNDYELLDTLLDLNATIFADYQYRQGSTGLSTSPFDVYVNRRGVCQDFANLFICLARLIGVPARYVCGYLFTGERAENARMADASHAWVQVYLPEVGWKGFDPTNGVLTQTDHVRVAAGRNYTDATPTSGTLYVGGGGETLLVEVSLKRK